MKVPIPSTVELPESIQIKLVREDMFDVSNIFRILFEVSITLFGAMFGAYVSSVNFEKLHWLLFFILLVFSIVFLILWVRYYRKAKHHNLTSSKKEISEFPFRFAGFRTNISLDHVETVTSLLNDLNIDKEQIVWHENKVKTDYKTLRIKKIPFDLVSTILREFDYNSIGFIDLKMEI